ncbi:MAG: hypothetical protein AAF208_14180, partial [Cyanobacteria bacterium P01_A01_bin.45]
MEGSVKKALMKQKLSGATKSHLSSIRVFDLPTLKLSSSKQDKISQVVRGRKRNLFAATVAAGLIAMPFFSFISSPALAQKPEKIELNYGKLLEKINKGEVKKVQIDET